MLPSGATLRALRIARCPMWPVTHVRQVEHGDCKMTHSCRLHAGVTRLFITHKSEGPVSGVELRTLPQLHNRGAHTDGLPISSGCDVPHMGVCLHASSHGRPQTKQGELLSVPQFIDWLGYSDHLCLEDRMFPRSQLAATHLHTAPVTVQGCR